jgi:hypothetical protein
LLISESSLLLGSVFGLKIGRVGSALARSPYIGTNSETFQAKLPAARQK